MTTGLVENEIPKGPVPYIYENSGGLIYEADHVYELIKNGKCLEITSGVIIPFYEVRSWKKGKWQGKNTTLNQTLFNVIASSLYFELR